MTRTDFNYTPAVRLDTDGDYRINLNAPFNTMHAEWESSDIPSAGLLTFSVNGDPGDPPGVIDLSSPARVLSVGEARLSHIDINVSGLPAGGVVVLRVS